jgi:hypothetical protein
LQHQIHIKQKEYRSYGVAAKKNKAKKLYATLLVIFLFYLGILTSHILLKDEISPVRGLWLILPINTQIELVFSFL